MGILGGAGLLMVGCVLLVVVGQSAAGVLERDSSVGIRTRKTMASDAAWGAEHRAAARVHDSPERKPE